MGLSSRDFSDTELADVRAAEQRRLPFLLYRDRERTQRLLSLEGVRLTVGRGAENGLSLSWDHEASRLHALLECLGGSWTVVDDQLSRNGTLVNGARVNGRRRLNDLDVIRVGSTQLLFRDPTQAIDETPPASGREAVAAVTAAQRRVLKALCRPLVEATAVVVPPPSNPEVAAELGLSVEAVRTHLKTLFLLFEVPDLPQNRKRAELARRALASGVVTHNDILG